MPEGTEDQTGEDNCDRDLGLISFRSQDHPVGLDPLIKDP